MRSNLGYRASELNVPINDDTRKQRRVVSVRGEAYGVTWHRLRSVAFVVFAVAMVLRNVIPVPEGGVPVVPTVLTYASVVAYLVALVGRVRTRRYAWVECKNLKRRLSSEDVARLHELVQRARANKNSKWKPTAILMVAGANGFDRPALAFAHSLGIECYRRTESGFERSHDNGSSAHV